MAIEEASALTFKDVWKEERTDATVVAEFERRKMGDKPLWKYFSTETGEQLPAMKPFFDLMLEDITDKGEKIEFVQFLGHCGRSYSTLVAGGVSTTAIQPFQPQSEEDLKKVMRFLEKDNFFINAKLRVEMLSDNGLQDYIDAATATTQDNNSDTTALLDYLKGIQTIQEMDEDVNTFVTILASSGTGKTQLAATAALTYSGATTVYLNFGVSNRPQKFYVPHLAAGAKQFHDQILEFIKMITWNDEVEKVSATAIQNWANSQSDDGTSILVHILYKLLCDEDSPQKCFLKNLKTKIQEKTFLVFLDEVPKKDNIKMFNSALCLRNILRYLGIAPILMSTHTGAQEYVGDSSRGIALPWVHLISILPPYQGSFPLEQEKLNLENERPLVLKLALRAASIGKNTVKETVRFIRKELQKRKISAWITSPALQLVQLFCTQGKFGKEKVPNAHRLVGHHFGNLHQGVRLGRRRYYSQEAKQFGNHLKVAPLCADLEPLLYLALVTWDETMLKPEPDEYFPLIDSSVDPYKAITVRQAYIKSRNEFEAKASTANIQQGKANGDLLEVLVHASLTLASMKTSTDDNEYLAGVPLQEFLPLVRRFMLPGCFGPMPLSRTLGKLLDELGVASMTIPALGGSNSGLPSALAGVMNSSIGYLERPKNKEMVDGLISRMKLNDHGDVEEDEPFMSIECKNYTDGVDAGVLKEVFERITPKIQVCLVFVSTFKGKGKVFSKTPLKNVKAFFTNTEKDPEKITILKWDKECDEPGILRVGEGLLFQATKDTELLVVIIEVGNLEDDKEFDLHGDKKRKRSQLVGGNYFAPPEDY